jgi:RNA polymerase sigma-70 factor (ECF subfamily)
MGVSVARSGFQASQNSLMRAAQPSPAAFNLLRPNIVAHAPHRAESSPPLTPSLAAKPAPKPASDEAAFPENLYEALAPLVNKLLWTLLGPDSERDDLAHEIFVRILQNAHKVRDPARLQAWAARLVVNAVKNEFRRRKLRRWFSLDTDDERAPSYHSDYDGREVLLRTYSVLEKLPPRERLPLTLRLIGQQSVAEIASASGASTRTVKRRLQAGRERFLRLASAEPLLAERLQHAQLGEEEDDA